MTNQDVFDNKFSTLNKLFRKKEDDLKTYYKNNSKLHRYSKRTYNLHSRLCKSQSILYLTVFILSFTLLMLLALSFVLNSLFLCSFALLLVPVIFLCRTLDKNSTLLKRIKNTELELIEKQRNYSGSDNQRAIVSFLNNIDRDFFDKIEINDLNEDEKQVLLIAIRSYRKNIYNSKPTDEKIEELYAELGLAHIIRS